jgi:hypothetical protein
MRRSARSAAAVLVVAGLALFGAACAKDDTASRTTADAPELADAPSEPAKAPPPGVPAGSEIVAPESPAPPKVRDLPVPPSPFGPGYDPTRDPPAEPDPTGPGFERATLVAFGNADVEELRNMADSRVAPAAPLVGVVLEVEVSAGTVTPPINVETASLRTKSGAAGVLFADCVPKSPHPQWIARPPGTVIGHWHVAIGDRTWFCGGGTAKVAARAGGRGTWIKADRAWKGELLLLFARPEGEADAVVIPGHTIELPASCKPGASPACEIPAATPKS